MASSKKSSSSLTSHGVMILSTAALIVLAWRASGGSPLFTTVGGIILLGLVLTHYDTIMKQLEGI